ncbi:hypothetical protein [Streptomyces nondiastaticus]|uniref:Uncharacterized protein n=1 Tax=Streptomyces nondiastaticus TaxID=3154512 RepID=A0ABW6U7K6_9ACTN
MAPYAAAPTGYVVRPSRYSRPDQPRLYRFWTNLARLHAASLTRPAGTGG